jgi:hypothetical protein
MHGAHVTSVAAVAAAKSRRSALKQERPRAASLRGHRRTQAGIATSDDQDVENFG